MNPFRWLAQAFRRTRPIRSRTSRFRPRLEVLDERLAPAYLTITTPELLSPTSVRITGNVSSGFPEGFQVEFTGAVSGSTTTDSHGSFTFTSSSATLGQVDVHAWLSTEEDWESTSIVNQVPDFAASNPSDVEIGADTVTIENWATFDPGAACESWQTPTYIVSNVSNPDLFLELPSIDANGTLTYKVSDVVGGSATFDVRVKDSGGGTDTSAVQTFTVLVDPTADLNARFNDTVGSLTDIYDDIYDPNDGIERQFAIMQAARTATPMDGQSYHLALGMVIQFVYADDWGVLVQADAAIAHATAAAAISERENFRIEGIRAHMDSLWYLLATVRSYAADEKVFWDPNGLDQYYFQLNLIETRMQERQTAAAAVYANNINLDDSNEQQSVKDLNVICGQMMALVPSVALNDDIAVNLVPALNLAGLAMQNGVYLSDHAYNALLSTFHVAVDGTIQRSVGPFQQNNEDAFAVARAQTALAATGGDFYAQQGIRYVLRRFDNYLERQRLIIQDQIERLTDFINPGDPYAWVVSNAVAIRDAIETAQATLRSV